MAEPPLGQRPRSQHQAPRARHLAGIDGLRAVAALSVLIDHVGENTIEGSSAGKLGQLAALGAQGLTLFFALSGFLLFLPFVSALLSEKRIPSIGRYCRNRILRIYPAYWVIFAIVFIAGELSVHGYHHGSSALYARYGDIGRITDIGVLVPNVLLLQTLVPGAVLTGIVPAWSLTTELTFYALLPLIALLSWWLVRHGISRTAALSVGPFTLIVIGVAVTLILNHMTNGLSTSGAFDFSWGQGWSAVVARSILAQADLFGFGMLAAIALELLRRRRPDLRMGQWQLACLLAGIVAVVGATLHFDGGLTTTIVGVCASVLILLTVIPTQSSKAGPNFLAKCLDWTPIRYIGLTSYSIYLWHFPVIFWLKANGVLLTKGSMALIINSVIVFSVVLVLASCTYYLVEKPCMALRGRLPSRTVVMG